METKEIKLVSTETEKIWMMVASRTDQNLQKKGWQLQKNKSITL